MDSGAIEFSEIEVKIAPLRYIESVSASYWFEYGKIGKSILVNLDNDTAYSASQLGSLLTKI